jgi:hypothetical protein
LRKQSKLGNLRPNKKGTCGMFDWTFKLRLGEPKRVCGLDLMEKMVSKFKL